MSNSEKELLHRRRFVLENPSAHIEQLIEIEASESAAAEAVSASRMLLQNPYAHLDGDGGLSALMSRTQTTEKQRTWKDIEQLAASIQRRLWKEQSDLGPTSPIDVLDPVKAAELLGFRMNYYDSLGVYIDRFEKVAVAGILDRDAGEIRISREFPVPAQRFTAAHEVGHLVLHPQISVLHRDRAIDGSRVARDHVEFEADKFAAYFLLPEKLVRREFEGRFLTQEFELNEDTSFALGKFKPRTGMNPGRALSRTLATAIQFNGKFFRSLSENFNVTPETVAIRLEELNLVTLRNP
jgi:Zn-dependent peptidase ImmA (M78 family)